MRRNRLATHLSSMAVFLVILLAGCSQATPEPTATAPTEETPVFETPGPMTPEPESTVTIVEEATDEAPGSEDETPDATSEIEASETPQSSELTAIIVSGDSAGVGKPFTFDATQSHPGREPIVNYVWSMGDGATLFGLSVEHAYSEPGFYTVTLIITDRSGQTDVAAKVVEIIDLEEETTPTPEFEVSLVGTAWELSNAIRGTTIILVFDERLLSGSSGCNQYSANYSSTIVDETTTDLTVASISATDNTCTSEIMAQERGYLESLASASRAIVNGDTLTLTTGSGTLIFSRTDELE